LPWDWGLLGRAIAILIILDFCKENAIFMSDFAIVKGVFLSIFGGSQYFAALTSPEPWRTMLPLTQCGWGFAHEWNGQHRGRNS
jgi:hypothetical protein